MSRDPRPILYSTDGSHLERCPHCGQHPCACPGPVEVVPGETRLRMCLDRKGRGGKTVTVVYDLPPNAGYCAGLLKQLKTHCGCGGALRGDALEIQGDQRDKVQAFLAALGFAVRRSGG